MSESGRVPHIAYFCMEYGLTDELPIYAGGLGILAGDFLKTAADLAKPIIGIGILWRQGYTSQHLSEVGWPNDDYPMLESLQAQNTGIEVSVTVGEKQVTIAVWRVTAYENVPLYLLEVKGENAWITSRLYGGNEEHRIAQEIVLGIGGVRALRKLKLDVDIYHFNEGHAVLAATELLQEELSSGCSFESAWQNVRRRIVFTTHTPVDAGNERHSLDVLARMGALNGLTQAQMAAIGGNPFNMTVAGLRTARIANAVAQQHGITARQMWDSVTGIAPIVPITNGIHPRTWQNPAIALAYEQEIDLWPSHQTAKAQLLAEIETRTGLRLNPKRLLLGLARRVVPYKRNDLILSDLDRIGQSLENGTLQLVFAGKAHPDDFAGKELLQRLVSATKRYPHSVVFLENYNMKLGQLLVQGCDVWLNTPRRPQEASGTSGMKAAFNGVLNMSVLDGWWPEACEHGVNGWQIGDGYQGPNQDEFDLESLYRILFNEVIPTYYQDPVRWRSMMRASIDMAQQFSSHRMLEQYFEILYFERSS